VPNIARLIGIKPEDLVLVAEFCGGGFGSKIPGYPNMAIAALLSKKINRPVMHRISRIEEYGIGSARPDELHHVRYIERSAQRVLTAVSRQVQQRDAVCIAIDTRLNAQLPGKRTPVTAFACQSAQ